MPSPRNLCAAFVLLAVSALALLAQAPDPKPLTIHGRSTWQLRVIETGGDEYLPLSDVLELIGPTSLRISGLIARLRHGGVTAEFANGESRYRLGDQSVTVSAPFRVEAGRLLVPIDVLPELLGHFLKGEVRFDRAQRALFLPAAPLAAADEVPAASSASTGEPLEEIATETPTVSTLTGAKIDTRPVTILIDAAHGGDDSGVRFSDQLLEKDITLALARKLKASLQDRGIRAALVRDRDEALTLEERAFAANHHPPRLYVSIHAGSIGRGVRVYSVSPGAAAQKAGFVPWQQVQAAYARRSKIVASGLTDAFTAKRIRAEALTWSVPPLPHVAAPAVAIEIAPPKPGSPHALESPEYQDALIETLASGLIAGRARMERAR